MTSSYTRRIEKSRREIIMALVLTMAALALSVGALVSRTTESRMAADPVALQSPVEHH